MSCVGSFGESQIPSRMFSAFMASGVRLFNRQDYDGAISSLSRALALEPLDRHCLVRRSKCYLVKGHLKNALMDAENSLRLDGAFCQGLYQKAEVLYHRLHFQEALKVYRRGQRLHPHYHKFTKGIEKTERAIRNTQAPPP